MMPPAALVCRRCGFTTPARPGAKRVHCDRCGHRLDVPDCDCARCSHEPRPPSREEVAGALRRQQEEG